MTQEANNPGVLVVVRPPERISAEDRRLKLPGFDALREVMDTVCPIIAAIGFETSAILSATDAGSLEASVLVAGRFVDHQLRVMHRGSSADLGDSSGIMFGGLDDMLGVVERYAKRVRVVVLVIEDEPAERILDHFRTQLGLPLRPPSIVPYGHVAVLNFGAREYAVYPQA